MFGVKRKAKAEKCKPQPAELNVFVVKCWLILFLVLIAYLLNLCLCFNLFRSTLQSENGKAKIMKFMMFVVAGSVLPSGLLRLSVNCIILKHSCMIPCFYCKSSTFKTCTKQGLTESSIC